MRLAMSISRSRIAKGLRMATCSAAVMKSWYEYAECSVRKSGYPCARSFEFETKMAHIAASARGRPDPPPWPLASQGPPAARRAAATCELGAGERR